ncbi:nitrate regulatory gene2 protein [Selaginella moellendorffii]|uniref:nitrate regulatory gene2 protein n=1 Tax=Selaginella moellendorffii TaxID=88036 RepID=UPI000D1CB5BD|nr:nitrate regulatory gene2 protein [Selaginella moellendorffii]XP_024524335.1 nitrate regulatory gene2 protein [Selaginella moellendorffii]XP_024524346.1 nitrate regulatory gene2 protein [Selaginella moellendorffii]|eukprot:XP_002960235.2 nitrate regulatory gene2 protein [Selaginella moellendorffii]
MGCATSKIENEEVVALCSSRKRHVKEAVSARHNFAAAFSNYVIALKTIGSAFSQFKEAEFQDTASPTFASSTPMTTATPMKPAKPPPLPPLYGPSATSQQKNSPSPMVLNPMKRTVSLPPMNFERKKTSAAVPKNADNSSTPPVKAARSSSSSTIKKKKEVSPSPSPSPEPELREQQASSVMEEELTEPQKDVKESSSVENNVKVSSEDEDDWVPPPPPPPVPSSKAPPPPPPPPSSSWMSDLFEFSHSAVPLPRSDDNEEEFDGEDRRKQQQLEEEKRRKLQEEEEKEAQRKEEEERKLKLQQQQEMELKQKQQEQMHRLPSTVDEGDEDEDEEEEEQDEDELDEEEEEEEDGEEEEETEEAEPEEEPAKKTVSYDLPKSDLSIVTSSKRGGNGELVAVLKRIVEPFEVAYESGRHVASMLEAQRVSFHPNFIDGRSDETHAKKVLRAISWSSSNSSLARAAAEQSVFDDESGDATGTHASTLDRLLAWEKKLYDEVKRAEGLRVELEKKNTWIQKEESRGGNAEAIEKAKAAEKLLHTRHVVAMQGVDTARNAVLRLRDSELYPQLLELLKGLYEMWKKTHECHEEQYKAVAEMKKLDCSDVVESTNSLHKVATEQLKVALSRWHQYFGSVVSSHKVFMQQLNVYVKVSVKSVELDKGIFHAASPKPISTLCHEWQMALDRLPDRSALEAINTFVADLQLIVDMQKEESRHRKKVEALEKEVKAREIYVEKYERKHVRSAAVSRTVSTDENGEVPVEVVRGGSNARSVAMTEKRAQLEVLKRRRDEEREKAEELGERSKAKTISSLELGLPSIFYAARAFSKQCFEAHERLQGLANSSMIMDK